ncbi:NACHT and TPR domain-containing protein [Colletotrichum kahawae]|uniref:NACHT and TPR domain-containing protein n=1 Tax=Colletotrichum kahawae TaxID=34407 RepID=A0AAE0D146_COLKA|nr:NACHT and TPR domain-containing protein [Colletotrichum kahawae]
MASVLAQRVPDDMAGDNRDVADLWKDALKTYKGIVGFDLERKFENVEAMITQGTKEMQNFHKFRHDDKKVDKLRGLFSANLDYIEKGAQQLVAAAVPAFPPAAAIGTAVTFMLSACRKVSADYDIVMVFFEDMNSFLQRIVILETRLPKYNAYQNCLMEVFTSFLTMCGFAHKYIELGRFKNWISSLIQGEDSELGGARKKTDLRIRRLQEATKFAILGNTEEIQKMTSELQKNQHSHTAMLAEQTQVMSVVRDTTESIRDDMAKLLRAFDDQKREQNKQRGGGDQKGKPSAAEHGKHPSAKGIRNTLMEVEGEDHEYHVLQETIVPDTCAWAFREPEWERWLHQQDPPNTVLAITGSPGMGKSHLAFSVYQALKSEEVAKDSSRRTCVAQFYFREQDESLSSFTNGVISVINQVAEQSPELCEAMYAEIVRDESQIDRGSSDDLLRKLLGVAFGTDSKGRLFLVFDGIDEIADKDLALFEQFGKTIEEGALRISMVYTARSGISVQESSSNPPLKVHITREKQMDDLRTIIWARINSLGALRRFSRYVQQRIADKTEEIAPKHLLARLNTLEREGAVLRSLEKPLPPTLYQLYEVTTAECFRRTESSRRALVSKLLQWIAYSLRPINLNEGLSLLRFWSNDDDFDLEEIPEPFAKLLRIGDPDSGAETRAKIQSRGGWGTAIDELEKAQKASQPDDLYQDGNLPIKFRERSMRGFFREEPVEPNEGHRPRRSEAHRQMFLACFNFIQPAHHNTVNVDKGLREYAVNYVLHHWRDIEEKHLNVEQQAEVMETFASLMLDKSSFAKIQEEELRIEYAIYDDEKFDDSFFDRLRSWAGLSLNMEAAEWWALIADRPRDCLVQLAKSHVRRLQYAVDIKTAEVSFLAAKDALRIVSLDTESF